MSFVQDGEKLIGAIDQGTSSTRFLVFNKNASVVAVHQEEVKQEFPRPGWVEEDPEELIQSVVHCVDKVCEKLLAQGVKLDAVKAVGITNQRESLVVWDKTTGKPLCKAIIWCDSRTADTVEELCSRCPGKNKYYFQEICGLPLSTYFTAVKLKWLIDNNPVVSSAVQEGRCYVGTVDTWLLWNLTGGVEGGNYATDVSNASRTMLLNLKTLEWDTKMCKFFDISVSILPKVCTSSEIYGHLKITKLKNVTISGILGDQQAALVGQRCLQRGLAKNTYGTGCFLLFHTGNQPMFSRNGLLTTVAYKFGPYSPACYALEGSIAVAGSGVQWLRDNLGIINSASEVEELAQSVSSSEGCCFVPAFSGLLCPYWQPDAQGIISGLSQKTTKAHIVRALLEAVCFQISEVVEAMNRDSEVPLEMLLVDGGMSSNKLLMQMQADTLGLPVYRPQMAETTALGAAIAAGIAEGVNMWDLETLPEVPREHFIPSLSDSQREKNIASWKKAIERVLV